VGLTQPLSTTTKTHSPRDMRLDDIDVDHWFDGIIGLSVDSQPEGLVSSDSVTTNVRA